MSSIPASNLHLIHISPIHQLGQYSVQRYVEVEVCVESGVDGGGGGSGMPHPTLSIYLPLSLPLSHFLSLSLTSSPSLSLTHTHTPSHCSLCSSLVGIMCGKFTMQCLGVVKRLLQDNVCNITLRLYTTLSNIRTTYAHLPLQGIQCVQSHT